MAGTTPITWTDGSWNPWEGCDPVSPGCDHCYMMTLLRRFGKDPTTVRRTANPTFNAPLKWSPRHIFTCSMSDFFIVDADEWRPEAWDIIKRTPQHVYQILTKRPSRMLDWAREHGWPDHAWAGVSVESPKYLYRIDVLRQVPAKHRFLSLEPLLEDLGVIDLDGIDAVIVGGESGPGFRPMDQDWVRCVRDQCLAAGVFFHFKQSSGSKSGKGRELDGRVWNGWPQTNRVGDSNVAVHA